MSICDITVGIPTYKRVEKLQETLTKIFNCNPRPNEIIVHVDGNDHDTEDYLIDRYPEIKVIKSQIQVGPGGGRNKIISEASNQLVASFDDDSYPIDPDYFERLLRVFDQFPNAAIVDATIYHIDQKIEGVE